MGDTVVSTVTKREIGRINDIAVSPSKMISYDINTNKPKITETGALCDVFIKMSAECEAGQSILVGGVEIKVGKSLYLFTKDLYFEGTVGEIYD
jgi:hypothetical protein